MSYLVLHVRPYAFTADDGRRVEGASIAYLDQSTPVVEGELGLPVLELTVPIEVSRQFSAAPGYYEMKFSQKRGKGGRPVLSVAAARHLSGVRFEANKPA